MATKAQMTEQILELDPDADVDGLTKDELESLLDSLQPETGDEPVDDAPEQPETAPEPVQPVSDGKARTIGNARENGSVRVAGIELAAKGEDGDCVQLTPEQERNQLLIGKLVRNIASGLLEWR